MTKLRTGRRGLMRNGKVTKTLRKREKKYHTFPFTDGVEYWTKTGCRSSSAGLRSDKDIIALIPEGWTVLDNKTEFPMVNVKLLLTTGEKLKRTSYTFENWPGTKNIAAFKAQEPKVEAITLHPCQFCEGRSNAPTNFGVYGWEITCSKCETKVVGVTEEEAVQLWNDQEPRTSLTETPPSFAYSMGQRVTKTKGSSWTGKIVGWYSTKLTPEGYAVESENEPGSVQIYPIKALQKSSPDPEWNLT